MNYRSSDEPNQLNITPIQLKIQIACVLHSMGKHGDPLTRCDCEVEPSDIEDAYSIANVVDAAIRRMIEDDQSQTECVHEKQKRNRGNN